MPSLYDRWSQAKSEFDKTKALFPADAIAKLNKGAGLGPALKTFDKTKGVPERLKALLPVRTAKETYDREIRAVMALVKKKDSPAFKALQKFEANLQTIWLDADKSAQPPRPNGSTAGYEVIRNFNLAGKVKPKHLDIKATEVSVVIEVDKTLDKLIKAGEESLKIDHLGGVAKAELDKYCGAFSKTMHDIDAKAEGMDLREREKTVKEANEVLRHYTKLVEDRLNAAVEKEWKEYLARRQYLSDFRLRCGVKIVLGSIAFGVSTASAVMSFGALWMNIAASVKAASDLCQTVKTWSQDIDSVYGELLKDIDKVNKLNVQREQAKKTGAGQKASKLAEVSKELVTGILPITKNMVTAASDVELKAQQLLGLVSKLEDKADKLVGQLNKIVSTMSKLPVKQMNEAMKKEADKLQETVEKLFTEITDLHRKAQNCAKFGKRALMAARKLRVEDLWTGGLTAEVTGMGTKGVAIYALANFALQCAKNGTTLLALL